MFFYFVGKQVVVCFVAPSVITAVMGERAVCMCASMLRNEGINQAAHRRCDVDARLWNMRRTDGRVGWREGGNRLHDAHSLLPSAFICSVPAQTCSTEVLYSPISSCAALNTLNYETPAKLLRRHVAGPLKEYRTIIVNILKLHKTALCWGVGAPFWEIFKRQVGILCSRISLENTLFANFLLRM